MVFCPRGQLFGLAWLLLGLAGCSREALVIADAWIAEAPPTVTAQAGYLVLENNANRELVLVGASSTVFDSIELHRTVYEADSGLARMLRQERIAIAPGARFLFEPGGYHLMLLDPKAVLREGELVPLTLIFADGQRREVKFEVRREQFRL